MGRAPRIPSSGFFPVSKLKPAAPGFPSGLHVKKVFLGSFDGETEPRVEIQRMPHFLNFFYDNLSTLPTRRLFFIFITNLQVL